MRTASTTLTAAMTAMNKPPIWKVVLSRAAASTRAYDNTRVIKISHAETPTGDTCELVFNNSDGALTSLNFEHYQAAISYGYNTGIARSAWVAGSTYAVDAIVIPTAANTNGYQYRCSVAGTVAAVTEPTWSTTLGITIADSAVTWEVDGLDGQEYLRAAPLRNRVQEMHSGRGLLRCIIRPKGILDQLKEDGALSEITYTSAETATVQSLITLVAGTGMAAYSTYAAYTVTYDSTDSIIGNFAPADYFAIRINDNRFEKVQELLDYTGCKMRINNDGQIHVFDPVTAGTAYDYEYKFNVSGSHNFWNEAVRLRFVEPNEVVVKSHPDHENPQYSGSATSATSFALAPKTQTVYRRLASNAQASSIASAMIERHELDAEIGFATVPMNVAQELWDYVKVTDSRMGGTTRIGNIQFLQRDVEVHSNNQPLTWTMMFSFGKVTIESLLMAGLYAGGAGEVRTLTYAQQIAMYNQIIDRLNELYDAQNRLRADFDGAGDGLIVKKLTITEELTIPSWS